MDPVKLSPSVVTLKQDKTYSTIAPTYLYEGLTKENAIPKQDWNSNNVLCDDDADSREAGNADNPLANLANKTGAFSINSTWNQICQCFATFRPPKPKLNEKMESKVKTYQEANTKPMEAEFSLNEIVGESEILLDDEIMRLARHLPPTAVGYPWILSFTTSKDGFSLHNLYRKLSKVDSPALIAIEDTKGRVFGALASTSLKISGNFYGTSQSFFYRCRPKFEIFNWSGENFYFIRGEEDSISLGSGNGNFGLWLDSDLYKGRSEECLTYKSPPLVEEKDFLIKTLECWTFRD